MVYGKRYMKDAETIVALTKRNIPVDDCPANNYYAGCGTVRN
ncbi:hypothetical protein BH10BAC2_BH10BAC2_09110 [soil metagenome]